MRAKVFKMGSILMPLTFLLLMSQHVRGQEETTTTTTTFTNTTTVTNFDNIELISDLLDLFNLAELGRQWSEVSGQLTTDCRIDMTQYLDGLNVRKLWALKSKS